MSMGSCHTTTVALLRAEDNESVACHVSIAFVYPMDSQPLVYLDSDIVLMKVIVAYDTS